MGSSLHVKSVESESYYIVGAALVLVNRHSEAEADAGK